ncbi:MAG: hypothetical protein OXI73_06730 [Rhodospirillales bacterium]|nr:hypothetical protein [Rhodospirillales bacterium]
MGDYNFARDGKFGYCYVGLFLLVLSMLPLYPGGLINTLQQTSSMFSKSGMADKFLRRLAGR